VSGAIRELTFSSSWRDAYGISADEAAERALEMFNLYLQSGEEGECGMNCCCEDEITIKRIDPDTGRMQISTDGGDTWTSDPNDPQYAVIQLPPAVTSGVSNTKCDAATNALQRIMDIIAETSSNIATVSSVYELAVIITGAILAAAVMALTGGALSPVAVAITGIIWGAGSAAFTAGQAAFDDYWSSENLDIMLCALVDNIGDDGAFTEAQYQGWRSQAKFNLPSSPARDLVMTAINAVGAAGLSNMAANGAAADADCADCDDTCWTGWEAQVQSDYPPAWGTVVSRVGNVMTIEATEVISGQWRAAIYNVSGSNCHSWHIAEIFTGGVYAMPCGYSDYAHFADHLGDAVVPSVVNGGIFLSDNTSFTLSIECTG